jgi:hypothetical protein
MTTNERIQAVVDFGFTERQAHARDAPCRGLCPTPVRALCGHLTRAITLGGDLDSLVRELRDHEARRRDVLAVIVAGDTAPRYDLQVIERDLRTNRDAWRALLTSERLADGRQFLREAFEGPLLFTPDGRRYRFEGVVDRSRLIAGAVGDPDQCPS